MLLSCLIENAHNLASSGTDTANLLSEYVYRVNASHGLSALRHLSIFGFLLKARLREEDDSNVIKMMLPAVDAKFVMSQRKHPVALIMKIRQIVSYEARAGNLEVSERTLWGKWENAGRIVKLTLLRSAPDWCPHGSGK